jgi:hypothetical protein
LIELSVQLDRAGCPHDERRLLRTDDVVYRLWLRGKLERHTQLRREDDERARARGVS